MKNADKLARVSIYSVVVATQLREQGMTVEDIAALGYMLYRAGQFAAKGANYPGFDELMADAAEHADQMDAMVDGRRIVREALAGDPS